MTPAASPPPTCEEKPKRKCRPHGRRRLPENLPRVPKHHELTEAERICSGCGHLREEIGTQTSEQLDYKPASLFVVENVVHKYACPCCSKGQPSPPGPESDARQEAPTHTPTVSALEPQPQTPTPPIGETMGKKS